jgi:hypothetical protein
MGLICFETIISSKFPQFCGKTLFTITNYNVVTHVNIRDMGKDWTNIVIYSPYNYYNGCETYEKN